MNRFRTFCLFLSSTLFINTVTTSCTKWLEVKSDDRVLESELYSTPQGFATALNGLYLGLAENDLYGQKLTATTFDILAQYYVTTDANNTHTYRGLGNYDKEALNRELSGIWKSAYTLIANDNRFLEYLDSEYANVLAPEARVGMMAQALGLRALLHFELFTIWDDIPYETTSAPVVQEILPQDSVAKLILRDLGRAERLCMEHPTTEGISSLRISLLSLRALTARVALYVGDKEMALRYARMVVEEAPPHFHLATRAEVTGEGRTGSVGRNAEDRVFSSEILFGVYHSRRTEDIYHAFFSPRADSRKLLHLTAAGLRSLYPYEQDLRLYRWQYLSNAQGERDPYLVLYGEVSDNGSGSAYLIPVIRLSEMYLIIAECEQSVRELNLLRTARKIPQLQVHETFSMDKLTEEYAREFAGEGQLFRYYKRRGIKEIPILHTPGHKPAVVPEYLYHPSLPSHEVYPRH